MKKTLLPLVIVTFLLLSFSNTHTKGKSNTEVIRQNQLPSLMERALLRSLNKTIIDVMSDHGDNQLFGYGRVEKVSGESTYDISLRVIGFEGAHNPPYKLIQMTIRIPGNEDAEYSVVAYSSRIISDTEFARLTKYATYN